MIISLSFVFVSPVDLREKEMISEMVSSAKQYCKTSEPTIPVAQVMRIFFIRF